MEHREPVESWYRRTTRRVGTVLLVWFVLSFTTTLTASIVGYIQDALEKQ